MMLTLACAVVLMVPAHQEATPTAQIAEANAKIRHALIEYKLDFNAVLRDPSFRDPERMQRFPGNTWPEMLGVMNFSPSTPIATLLGNGDGYDPAKEGSLAVTDKLETSLQPKNYQMIYLMKGVAPNAGVVANTYAAVYCKGAMDGALTFNSYATAIIDGKVSGRLFSDSYFNAVIDGDLSGSYENTSSCMVYVLGKLSGVAKLSRGAKLVIYGKTGAADLARIKGTGSVWLMNTDLPADTQHIGGLTVTVASQPGRSTKR